MLEYTIGSLSNREATYFCIAIRCGARFIYEWWSTLFFKLISQKVKKAFDKGQKVRYNLTIEKNKKSNYGCLIHKGIGYEDIKSLCIMNRTSKVEGMRLYYEHFSR